MTSTHPAGTGLRRVAVSGIGLVCPLGNSPAEAWARARAGYSAVRRHDLSLPGRPATTLAAAADFDPTPHFDTLRLRMVDRFSQLALVAARQAVDHADNDRPRA